MHMQSTWPFGRGDTRFGPFQYLKHTHNGIYVSIETRSQGNKLRGHISRSLSLSLSLSLLRSREWFSDMTTSFSEQRYKL